VLLDFPVNLSRVPIVHELVGEIEYETHSTEEESENEDGNYTAGGEVIETDEESDAEINEGTVASTRTSAGGAPQTKPPTRPSPPKKRAGQKTTVTRSVFQVCRRIFPVLQHKRFELRNHPIRVLLVGRFLTREEHGVEPTCIWQTKSSVEGYYTSVLIDSTVYRVSPSYNLSFHEKLRFFRSVMLLWSNQGRMEINPETRSHGKRFQKASIPLPTRNGQNP
jgi:hypothetical protein